MAIGGWFRAAIPALAVLLGLAACASPPPAKPPARETAFTIARSPTMVVAAAEAVAAEKGVVLAGPGADPHRQHLTLVTRWLGGDMGGETYVRLSLTPGRISAERFRAALLEELALPLPDPDPSALQAGPSSARQAGS